MAVRIGSSDEELAALTSANNTGTYVPDAQFQGQNHIVNTTNNALHNQRIVRARSTVGNPRVAHDTLANSDRKLGRYLNLARAEGLTLKQALGLEDIPASHFEPGKKDGKVVSTLENVFSVEQFAGCEVCPEPKRWEVYAVGDFGNFEQDALDTVNRGFQSDTWAGSVGVEYLVGKGLNVGAAYTYADNDTDLNEGLGNVDIEGNLYSVYATAFRDNRYVDVLYSYGDFENTLVRNTLTAGGFATGTPESDSHTFSINAGQNFEFCGLVTGPTLGFDYTDGEVDAYNETGGGFAALNYEARKYTSSISSVGWQVSKTMGVNAGSLTLQGFTSWEHEFTPEGGNVRASLANFPTALNLNQPGAAPGTDWMVLGAGVRLDSHCGWNFEVDYQTQLFRDDVTAHYVGGKVAAEF